MLYVTISVDCESANRNRCYTKELIEVSEACEIPLNWMLEVSSSNPLSNARMYYEEYIHRIPAWHEFGLHIHFDTEGGYIRDPQQRANLIRLGKEILKQHHIKPTSFTAGCFALETSDIPVLEDIGILVDSSAAPDIDYKEFVDWSGAPTAPYHPSREDVKKAGDSSLMIVPVATSGGRAAYLDTQTHIAARKVSSDVGRSEFEIIRPILEWHAGHSRYISIRTQDSADCAEALKETVTFLRERGALFVTLTQMHSIVDFEQKRNQF